MSETPTAAESPPPRSRDVETAAIDAILLALEPLEKQARERVVDYVFKRTGITWPPTSQPHTADILRHPLTPPPSSAPPSTDAPVRDIRTLAQAKAPTKVNEQVALVAYYLSEVAGPDERKAEVTKDDLSKYFRHANFPLPGRVDMALPNAAAVGYVDKVGEGKYKLSPVGYNLVAHNLPASGATAAKKTGRRPGKKGAKSR